LAWSFQAELADEAGGRAGGIVMPKFEVHIGGMLQHRAGVLPLIVRSENLGRPFGDTKAARRLAESAA
jgi:hypothetical protein